MKQHQVVFLPSDRRGQVDAGTTLLEVARRLGEGIESICGGQETCGKCKVRILEGTLDGDTPDSHMTHLSPMTATEKRYADQHGFRPN